MIALLLSAQLLVAPHTPPTVQAVPRACPRPGVTEARAARARLSKLGELPKPRHEKAVLRSIDGCIAPLIVRENVGR